MECNLTINFLKSTRLALITCADAKLLHVFSSCISSQEQSVYELYYTTSQEVSQKLMALIEDKIVINAFVHIQCDKYSKLRSIYFHITEDCKSDIQIFVLRPHEEGFKLECELGAHQGQYILFDYNESTEIFKEKV